MDTYNLNGRVAIWWNKLMSIHHLRDMKLNLKQFKKLFKLKYLLEQYYEKKIKEFHELKFG